MFKNTLSFITHLNESKLIHDTELEFTHFMIRIDKELTVNQLLIGLALHHFQNKGHVAIDQELLDHFKEQVGMSSISISLKEEAQNHPLVGQQGEYQLFIYEHGLLYTHKGLCIEIKLAEWIRKKAAKKVELSKEDEIRLSKRIGAQSGDPQSLALEKSFRGYLQFITGGPGTGKTFTVKNIIEAHKTFYGDAYRIKIAAPTGKAAQRINDALKDTELDFSKAVTIHQLLGASNSFSGFTFNQKNKLNVDLLIIDEASMMDLSLWGGLIDAIPEEAKLIVVGDPYQLASIESGAVLNDITSSSDQIIINKSIAESITNLTQNYRFSDNTGIQELSFAINSQDAVKVLSILKDKDHSAVQLQNPSTKNLQELLKNYVIDPALMAKNARLLNKFKILCAIRNGPFGTIYLNQRIESELKRGLKIPQSQEWFGGRIVMATKNNYQLGIQNGEIGVYDSDNDVIQFSENKKIERIYLKEYEPGYCITIHKSQGSEYLNVAIIIPDTEIPLLTKELFYTAVTRARQSVLVIGNEQIIAKSITKRIVRRTGLNKRIHV